MNFSVISGMYTSNYTLTSLFCSAITGSAKEQRTWALERGMFLGNQFLGLIFSVIPLDVAIQLPKRPLSAGKPVEVVCSSSGSRPPAVLTWWKSGEQLYASKEHQVQEGVSTSSSTILFTPAFEDNGLVLSCRAENQFIPGSAIEEGWKLDVFCEFIRISPEPTFSAPEFSVFKCLRFVYVERYLEY